MESWRSGYGCGRELRQRAERDRSRLIDRATLSAITHRGVPFANPLSQAAIDGAIAALALPAGARALDVGCGPGELLARLAARFGLRTEGVEAAAEWAAAARERVDVVHEARFAEVTLEPGAYDLVACLAASHAIGSWEESLRALAALARPVGGLALVGEGFWRREPSAGYLERLGGASADELPEGLDALRAGARAAGWEVLRAAVASDADWAAYEETALANGERWLSRDPDPDLRAWVDASRARWEGEGGRDTMGFALLTLRRA
jgi:SAM-dependent methyltransferase